MANSTSDQFESLLLDFKRSNKNLTKGEELVTYMLTFKPGQHPEVILEVGIEFAQQDANKLADITFAAFTEEFFVAALELKQMDWAQIFLRPLCQLFPNNVKTMRQLAMFYEAQNNTFKAQEIYLEIL